MGNLTVQSPLGRLRLESADGALVRLDWQDGEPGAPDDPDPVLVNAAAELAAYFRDGGARFSVPVRPAGTPFQHRVWAVLCAIPPGRTLTYGEVAARAGGVARAVGQACGANPIPIVIPCHRVLSGTGSGGFSAPGGLDTKRWLLDHETPRLL
ncbi:MAG TPA: methylated-DNA--[protein]-cysteine S-methyltransferase [Azospirillaceae bacterium]|nr:methylated-DNA--[protein]-cysteine S-methyltransferase [Azospirillaceae bacterium]